MPPKAWNIFHHFCVLLEAKFEQFNNTLFETVPITDNTIAQNIYEKFKKKTVASKDWKGFPTSKGPKNKAKGIPETTKMDKDHESVKVLFDSFFTKFKEEINEWIDTGIEKWVPPVSDESDNSVTIEEAHLPQVKLEHPQVKLEHNISTSTKHVSESSVKRKTEKEACIAEREKEIVKKRKIDNYETSTNELSEEMVDQLTTDLQTAIETDVQQQDKNMSRSKTTLSKIEAVVNKYLPEYEKKVKELEDRKLRLLKELDDELNCIKTISMANIMELKTTMDQVSEFIPEKEKEFAALAETKKLQKKTFFESLKKTKQSDQ